MKADLAWDIAETAHALRRFYDRRAQTLGVTRAQWRVLAMLSREPRLKQVSLAERLDIEPITLSRIIDRLAEAGLVARAPDPADRRAWRVELTTKAEPLIAQLFGLAEGMADEVFAALGDDEVTAMRAGLATIRKNICDRETVQKAVA
ncbi:MAG: MarR family transcriptional regulator [Sphingomicrobium sp.]